MAEEKLGTEIRREQIVAAALDLVASAGVRQLNIAAVAARVGLVPSGIYRHFKNKGEILDAVLDLVEARLMDNVAAARTEHAGAMERLEGVFRRHIRFVRQGRAIPRMIFSDDLHGGEPARKQHVLRIVHRYGEALAEIVRQGQQEHAIREEVAPDAAAFAFLGMIVPAGILWHLTDGNFDIESHADRTWPMFCKAIQTTPLVAHRTA